MKICDYGCGKEAKHQLKNGKFCCSYSYTVCVGKRVIKPLSIDEVNRIVKNKNLLKEFSGGEIKLVSDLDFPRTRKILVSCIKCEKTRTVTLADYLLSKTEFCKSCWRKGDNNPAKQDYVREKLSRKGIKNTSYATPTWKENFSKQREGSNNPMFGKKHKDETRKKMRLNTISRIKNSIKNGGQIQPLYNSDGCKIIVEYGKKNGYNFQHAENGGEFYIKELGYWVDGYDKDRNVVIEIDESFHFNPDGSLKEKDLKRQKEITDFLQCKFIRIKFKKE